MEMREHDQRSLFYCYFTLNSLNHLPLESQEHCLDCTILKCDETLSLIPNLIVKSLHTQTPLTPEVNIPRLPPNNQRSKIEKSVSTCPPMQASVREFHLSSKYIYYTLGSKRPSGQLHPCFHPWLAADRIVKCKSEYLSPAKWLT